MSCTMTQLNTRIPVDLKEQGDRALERAGYTPSQAVRALWEFAVRHAHEPGAVHAMLEEEKTDGTNDDAQGRLQSFEEGLNIVENAYEKLGIESSEDYDFQHLDYKELRNLYYEERLEQGE